MTPEELQMQLEAWDPLLNSMLFPKQPLSSAPTFVPQNAFQQWQLYENGSTRRLYLYVNGTWRYVALT